MVADRFGISDQGRAGRQVAARHRALDLAGQALAAPRTGTDERPARARRGRSDPRLRPQPARPAARRPGRRSASRIGLDPGIRTGCKVAVVDRHRQAARHRHASTRTSRAATGKARWPRCASLCQKHGVDLIAIGNGTASRETDKLAGDLIKRHPEAEADQGRGLRSRRLGLFGLRTGGHGIPGPRRLACAAPCRSPAACRTRWPNW